VTEAEEQQGSDVKKQQSRVKVAIVENLFGQKPPVDGPLEQELATKLERSIHVADRIDKQKRQTEHQLIHAHTIVK